MMRLSLCSKMLPTIMTLFILGCANQDGNDFNAQDGQQQGVIPNNQASPESETTPANESETSFPDVLVDDTPLYYAVHNGFLITGSEGGERAPYELCHFTPPTSWAATTVLATVTKATHSTNEPCVAGEEYLGSHHEVAVQIHTTLRGPSTPEMITLLYSTELTPRLLDGEHILTTFVEDEGRYFMVSSVYTEDSLLKFESARPGPDQIPSTDEQVYVRLPNTYGDLVEAFRGLEEGKPMECTKWERVDKEDFSTGLFRVDDSCQGAVANGGNHQPDGDDQTSNSASGD